MIKMISMVFIVWYVTQNGSFTFKLEWISATARGLAPLNLVHHLVNFISVFVVIIIASDVVIVIIKTSKICCNFAC
jgi:hypothetical protein